MTAAAAATVTREEQITPRHTVGQLVAQRPARSRLFEKLGIDYCCGGKKPLEQACREKNLDPATILTVIQAQDQLDAAVTATTTQIDAAAMSPTQLCDHIESTHHAYLKTELPRLAFLTVKVANAHGPADPRLLELARTFADFHAELESHMAKEEQILFPMIRQLDAPRARPNTAFHCGSINNPIRVMELEHQHAGDAMADFRRLTDDYTPPAHACNTYRALLDALHHLELDMHQHVHKENNVLFPKAAQLEQTRA
jgi:regulator of cell morphogenesis and NO signaling